MVCIILLYSWLLDCAASYSVFVVAATVCISLILMYSYSSRVYMYVSIFINAVYISIMCQVIGPCIFTDYTLAVGYLIF